MLYSYYNKQGELLYTPSFTIATIRSIILGTYQQGILQHK
jgi:hypothetical protein